MKSTTKSNHTLTLIRSPKAGTELKGEPGGGKHYIGFVIGILTVVIVILVAAIVFIVFRNQKLKMTGGLTAIPTIRDNLERIDCEKVRTLTLNSFFSNQSSAMNLESYVAK